jgi:hypothetical protein
VTNRRSDALMRAGALRDVHVNHEIGVGATEVIHSNSNSHIRKIIHGCKGIKIELVSCRCKLLLKKEHEASCVSRGRARRITRRIRGIRALATCIAGHI